MPAILIAVLLILALIVTRCDVKHAVPNVHRVAPVPLVQAQSLDPVLPQLPGGPGDVPGGGDSCAHSRG